MRRTQSHTEPHSRDRQAAQRSTAQHSQTNAPHTDKRTAQHSQTDRRQGQEAGTVGDGNGDLSVPMWECIMMQCVDGDARTEADRQTDRQADRQPDRQTDGRQTDRQERQAGRQADKQAGKQTNTQTAPAT